jgi:hypothetical protein
MYRASAWRLQRLPACCALRRLFCATEDTTNLKASSMCIRTKPNNMNTIQSQTTGIFSASRGLYHWKCLLRPETGSSRHSSACCASSRHFIGSACCALLFCAMHCGRIHRAAVLAYCDIWNRNSDSALHPTPPKLPRCMTTIHAILWQNQTAGISSTWRVLHHWECRRGIHQVPIYGPRSAGGALRQLSSALCRAQDSTGYSIRYIG